MPVFDENSPEGMLIAACLAGDVEAFSILTARYHASLLKAAASRVGRREIAEDVVQETLLCAHRWLGTYDSRFSFRTWLWTILLNQCSRQAKREAKHSRASADWPVADLPVCPENLPLEQLLTQERSEQLHALLARLPDAQADALRLRFFGGLSFAEIAAAMGCSLPGAKHRVKTGLLKLAQWLRTRATEPIDAPAPPTGEIL